MELPGAPAAGPTGGLHAAVALLQVLVQTFSALALGFFCVRYGFVDVQRGDLHAMQFFVGRVALPLQVFKVVATGNVGSVDVGVIVACSLGKVTVYALTFGMSLCAYRSKEPMGRRILTAAVFGFFTTASNDLAIGFPVIAAIYGDTMSVYLAANVLVFQTAIQPLAMVVFEVAQVVSGAAGPAEGSWREQRRELLLQVARSIALNPIMIATVLGTVYSTWLAFTLTRDPMGALQLPPPLGGVIQLWTSPFTMMFLFLSGTSLRTATLALWPAMLALMKVVVCAYISYGFSHVFVSPQNPKAQILRDFTFFYGTIPAGGAPLIFAQHFDCAVNVIASASILGLVLAGPIEFVTSLFLGTVTGPVNYYDVREVMHSTTQASALCSGIFVLFVILGWWGGSFSSRAIAVYGCITLSYEVWTLLLMAEVGCHNAAPAMFLFRLLQNVSYILVVYMEYHLGTRWREGRRARSRIVVLVVLAAALLATAVVPYGNTFHEMCGLTLPTFPATILVGWNAVIFLLTAALAARGRLLKQRAGGGLPARQRRADRTLTERLLAPIFGRKGSPEQVLPGLSPTSEASASGDTAAEYVRDERITASEEARMVGLGGDGVPVAVCLVVLQGVRSFMGIVNSMAQALARNAKVNERGFTPMLILADMLEHGQGCVLLLAVIFQPGVLAQTRELIGGLVACGLCMGRGGPLIQVGRRALNTPLDLYAEIGIGPPAVASDSESTGAEQESGTLASL